MHKGKRGVLFVFSGPSGVGKGTLKAKLFEEFADRIAYSVSATTRGPREGEVLGVREGPKRTHDRAGPPAAVVRRADVAGAAALGPVVLHAHRAAGRKTRGVAHFSTSGPTWPFSTISAAIERSQRS